MPLVGQPGNVVDRLAERAHRRAMRQRERRRRAVDAHQPARRRGPSSSRSPPSTKCSRPSSSWRRAWLRDEPRPVEEAAIERMRLEQQMRVGAARGRRSCRSYKRRRSACRERTSGCGSDSRPTIAAAGRTSACPSSAPSTASRRAAAALGAEEFPQPAKPLHDDRARAVRAIMAVAQPPDRRHCDNASRNRARGGGSWTVIGGSSGSGGSWLRFGEEPVLVAAERRARVDPLELERHPVGPQIAFLEHVRAHRRAARQCRAPRHDRGGNRRTAAGR